MCIVIDANALASVFKKSSSNHEDFKPVLDWILNGKGKIVYGGSKYNTEIKGYLSLFTELKRANKAILIDKRKVDDHTDFADSLIKHDDFDDQHIVGLLMASKCKLICSNDIRAYPYFRHLLFFQGSQERPKIYRGKSNASLLNDRNIASICRPCTTLNNSQKQLLNNFISNK